MFVDQVATKIGIIIRTRIREQISNFIKKKDMHRMIIC